MDIPPHQDHPVAAPAEPASVLLTHFWFKLLGTSAFTTLFLGAYIFLLKNPAHAVTLMPSTALDRWVGFEPLALWPYLSLWLYVSLPPALMKTRLELVEYGIWIGLVCVAGLAVFYFWPTAVPPSAIDWAQYPGLAFLKGVDAAGNACPSLHVATAVFSCLWLHRLLHRVRGGALARVLNVLWCLAIAYSTLATRQHVALDVVAGTSLGLLGAWYSRRGPLFGACAR
jgi:hypothetical protein